MQFNINQRESYGSVILRLSLFTAIGVFLCSLFGYFLLPFAAGSYAALIGFENRGKRIFTFLVPIVMFFVNLALLGPFSLEAIAYVVVGVIIYFLAKRGKSKGEVAFWISFSLVLMMLVSVFLFAMDYNDSISLTKAFEFYRELGAYLKEKFVEFVITLQNEGGGSFAFTEADATLMFNELILGIVPLTLILAFLISGLALKFFTRNLFKYADEEPHPFNWSFRTSNFVAYFYIATLIFFWIVPEDAGAFFLLVNTLYSLFSLVFAYLGVKFLYAFFLAKGKRPLLAILIIVAIFVVFSSFVVTAISLLGVYVNNSMNKLSRLTDKSNKKQ